MSHSPTIADKSTPIDRLLTASLVFAPLLYLAADSTYAALGWADPVAGVLHVVGAIAYGFVVLRIVAWLPRQPILGLLILLSGLIGMAGNVAYGFETIHMSLGDVQLVLRDGAANLIKPIGLFFPLSFALIAVALVRLGHRWQGGLLFVAILGWPIAHILNLGPVAIAVNLGLVVALGSLAWSRRSFSAAAAG